MPPARLFTPRWSIDRLTYLCLGLVLVAAKISLDVAVCRLFFHQSWSITNYVVPRFSLLRLDANTPAVFVGTMLTLAAPFAWVGICLTTQRLRAIRAPIWLSALFFVPLLKFILFALLLLLPSRPQREEPAPADLPPEGSRLSRWIPNHGFGSAALAVVLAALIGCGFAGMSIYWRQAYLGGLLSALHL